MAARDLTGAVTTWRACLGHSRVLDMIEARRRYGLETMGQSRTIQGALVVKDRAEVSAVLAVAREHRVPLYPISTGNNWGYGSASPMSDGCVILDLSGMNRILDLDRELGLVTVEPGVTQGRLREYLDGHAPGFMVPTTGAGPNCSLVGNALERGYGITPIADHFGAVTALEAVLPDGRLYRSALTEMNGGTVDRVFKWGLGPYLDGLFAQGNIGIVTQMTIALARRPERVEAFFFGVPHDAELEAAVTAVQSVLQTVGGTVGAINLMNARRVLAMTVPYPADQIGTEGVLPQEIVLDLARRHQIRAWMGVGALYGSRKVVAAARAEVRRLLRPVADRIVFMTPERSAFLGRLFRAVPGLRASRTTQVLGAIDQALEVIEGKPNEVALRLAYWRTGKPLPESPLNPAQDGCGLIWYPPLVPMKPTAVRDYVTMVNEICVAHGVEPLITLTSLTDRCFDSSVPLLFDRNDQEQLTCAVACYDALFQAGMSRGFVPYRLGLQAMSRVTGTQTPFWDLVGMIKSVIDPDQIIAPGRYAPVRAQPEGSAAMGTR